jgi:hypothetical protein
MNLVLGCFLAISLRISLRILHSRTLLQFKNRDLLVLVEVDHYWHAGRGFRDVLLPLLLVDLVNTAEPRLSFFLCHLSNPFGSISLHEFVLIKI